MKIILDTKDEWLAELKFAVQNEPHNILTMSVRVKQVVDEATKTSHLYLGYIYKGVGYVMHEISADAKTTDKTASFLQTLKSYCEKEGVNVLKGRIE